MSEPTTAELVAWLRFVEFTENDEWLKIAAERLEALERDDPGECALCRMWRVRAEEYKAQMQDMTSRLVAQRRRLAYLEEGRSRTVREAEARVEELEREKADKWQTLEHPFDKSEYDAMLARSQAAEARVAELERELTSEHEAAKGWHKLWGIQKARVEGLERVLRVYVESERSFTAPAYPEAYEIACAALGETE